MTRLEMCLEVLQESKKAMHVKEIAAEVINRFRLKDERKAFDDFVHKVNATLSSNFKSKKPRVTKPKNKQGKFKKGIYKAKAIRKRTMTPAPAPDVGTAYTGKAGEYGLLSELLFRGFNASIMTVDEGIDVVASKDNKYFHIQVKTANDNSGNQKYLFTIRPSAYESHDASTTFYAFIMRRYINDLWRSEYIMVSSIDIRRYIDTGVINSVNSYTLTITFKDGKCILNGKEDITWNLNQFEILR